MTPEQTIQGVMMIVGGLFGAGGVAAIIGHLVTRNIGLKTNENDANKVINTTWEAIVNDLQAQLTHLSTEVANLKTGHTNLEERLGVKERLVLKAIAHLNRVEIMLAKMGGEIPPRPEGLE